MRPYVKNGTPIHGPSLCDSCENAMTVKGYRESQEVVICEYAYPRLRVVFPVRECSRFMDRTREDLEEMKKIAWNVAPKSYKRTAGFVVAPATPGVTEPDDIEIVLDKQGNDTDSWN